MGNRAGGTRKLGNPSRDLGVGRKFLLFLLSLLYFVVDFELL